MNFQLLAELDKFLRWWSTGLMLAVPKSWGERRARATHYFIVNCTNDEVSVEFSANRRDRELRPVSIAASLKDTSALNELRQRIAATPKLKSSHTILRLPQDKLLVKRLRYPRSAYHDLRNVIRFDIDRQTPFARDDVYFDYMLADDDHVSDALELDLLIVPKREITKLEPAFAALGIRPDIIDSDGRTFFEHGVNLLPNPDARPADRPSYRIQFALFVLWMALITLIPGKQLIKTNGAIARLEVQEQHARAEIDDLPDVRRQHAELVRKSTFFDDRQARHVPAIALLNEVTRLLSDDTWIRRFELKDGSLTLQGESPRAAEILGILEGSRYFSEPQFSSPLTRNNINGNDRFQLRVAVNQNEPS